MKNKKPIAEQAAQFFQHLKQQSYIDADALIAAHQNAAPTSIRLHPQKGAVYATEGLQEVPWCTHAYYLPERPVFTLDPLFHAGAYYVQEASSMFLDQLLQQYFIQDRPLKCLDLCAAPGGKSTLWASRLTDESLLICNEVVRQRAQVLEDNIHHWAQANVWVCADTPERIGALSGYFDWILVDAPCSGSGLIRRDPEALNHWSEANVLMCQKRQEEILNAIMPALKEDGFLIYATCSYSQEENELMLDYLKTHYQMESLKIKLDNAWGIVETRSPQYQCYGYRLGPNQLEGEGLFMALLQKKEATVPSTFKALKVAKAQPQHTMLPKLEMPLPYCLISDSQQQYSALYQCHQQDAMILEKHLFFRKRGIALGQVLAKDFIPAHELALYPAVAAAYPNLELSLEEALLFLKKESISVDTAQTKSWYRICYKGLGLGWVKHLGNRVNNYLPKHWKIRMDIDSERD